MITTHESMKAYIENCNDRQWARYKRRKRLFKRTDNSLSPIGPIKRVTIRKDGTELHETQIGSGSHFLRQIRTPLYRVKVLERVESATTVRTRTIVHTDRTENQVRELQQRHGLAVLSIKRLEYTLESLSRAMESESSLD